MGSGPAGAEEEQGANRPAHRARLGPVQATGREMTMPTNRGAAKKGKKKALDFCVVANGWEQNLRIRVTSLRPQFLTT